MATIEDIINHVNNQLASASYNALGAAGAALNAASNNLIPTALRQSRIDKNPAKPIATLQTGYILNSDGSQSPGPNLVKLDILRKNVLDQMPFTQEVKNYLSRIPLSYMGPSKTTLGVYKQNLNPISRNVQSKQIQVNPIVVDGTENTPQAANTLIHEYLHSLDNNINRTTDYATLALPDNSANSNGFYANLQQYPLSKDARYGGAFLRGYGPNPNIQTQDSETFAQTGANYGENIETTPFGGYYDNILKSMNPVVNYSPVFPTKSFLDRLGQQDLGNAALNE